MSTRIYGGRSNAANLISNELYDMLGAPIYTNNGAMYNAKDVAALVMKMKTQNEYLSAQVKDLNEYIANKNIGAAGELAECKFHVKELESANRELNEKLVSHLEHSNTELENVLAMIKQKDTKISELEQQIENIFRR